MSIKYRGWPNKATQDAAIIIFGDKYYHDKAIKKLRLGVKTTIDFLKVITPDDLNICYRSILEEILADEYNNIPPYKRQIRKNYVENNLQYVTEQTTQKKEESTMKLTVETKHFVNGQDINNFTTDQKIQLLLDTEAQIKRLDLVESKSAMVAAEKEKLVKFLEEINALFDAK